MQILHNHSLKHLHTFAIECCAKQLVVVENDSDIDTLFEKFAFQDPYYIVGAGSNLLFSGNFDGTIIYIKTEGMVTLKEDATHVWIEAAAGVIFDNLIQYCVQNGWYGLENLAYIPGQVGSAAVQNVGAYGVEAKDAIVEVVGRRIPTGEKLRLQVNQCNYGYRNSIFKNEYSQRFLITSVVFKLSKLPIYRLEYKALQDYLHHHQLPLTLAHVYQAVVDIRKSKLPEVEDFPSAGSYFKNPIVSEAYFNKLSQTFPSLISYPVNDNERKLAAGQLIELCGWKGYTNGRVGVYEKQALVIVNNGNASGLDVIALSNDIKLSVSKKFGVTLHEEVIVL